jgi:hypothetical protein
LAPDPLQATGRGEKRLAAVPSRQRHSAPSLIKIATYRFDVETSSQLDHELSRIIEAELDHANRYYHCGLSITRHDIHTFTLAVCGTMAPWEVQENDVWMKV